MVQEDLILSDGVRRSLDPLEAARSQGGNSTDYSTGKRGPKGHIQVQGPGTDPQQEEPGQDAMTGQRRPGNKQHIQCPDREGPAQGPRDHKS